MKKIFKTVVLWCSILMMCLLPACSIGVYEVTFVDYEGTIVETRTYGNGESVTNANAPRLRTREGFDFVQWSYGNPSNIIPDGEVATERIMYAQYRLNEKSTIFEESGRTVQWIGGTTIAESDFKAGQTKTILIQDLTYGSNFSKLEITPLDGSAFLCETLTVYDKNGYEVNKNSESPNVWNVATLEAGEYNYAIVVTSSGAGTAQIKLS